VNVGNVLRALNLNPTNATIEKLGGTKKKGEKKLKLDEFLPIFSQCKKDKEQGCYEDFLECLKLYDKQENGMMLGAELSHTLLSLGKHAINFYESYSRLIYITLHHKLFYSFLALKGSYVRLHDKFVSLKLQIIFAFTRKMSEDKIVSDSANNR